MLLAFALNFAWELWQAKWFASMRGLPFWRATSVCARVALGDLVIMAIAFAVAAAVANKAMWSSGRRIFVVATTFIVVGIAIVSAYEAFALATGRWRYDDMMPTLFGIGVLPLIQWIVILLAEVMLFRQIVRDRSSREV